MSKLNDLHDAARPFVTRSLRGGRLRRYLALGALLGALTPLVGTWLTFGSGGFERGIRTSLDLESSRWQRQQDEFILEADTPEQVARINDELRRARPTVDTSYYDSYTEGPAFVQEAADTLRRAVAAEPTREHQGLQRAAAELLAARGLAAPPTDHTSWGWFNWYDEAHVRRVQAIVDAGLVPRVEVYRSPLGPVDAVRMIGGIAGALIAALMLILAPLLAGVQIAQEVHENTLQPLTGTALRGRELVLGLTAGPFAVIALFLAPQALIFLATALAAGHLLPALGALIIASIGAFFLAMLTQLLGCVLGATRAPGVVGVAMLSGLSMLAMIGAAFGLAPSHHVVGVFGLLPQAATAHLLRTTFVPHQIFTDPTLASRADIALGVGAVGMAILGVLGMRALERRISRTSLTALTRGEALLGAAVATLLVLLANPASGHLYSTSTFYISNLAVLSLPFAILLAMRVPLPEGAERRALPLASLLGELAAFAALHGLATLAVVPRPLGAFALSPVVYGYLGWYLLMLGLITIRATALPLGLAGRLWLGFSACFALVAFPHLAAWSSPWGERGLADIFGMTMASPVLGVLQAALMVAIPWLLIRRLRRA